MWRILRLHGDLGHISSAIRLVALGAATVFVSTDARADDDRGKSPTGDGLPPWTDVDDVPLPPYVRSVIPKRGDMTLFAQPARGDRRGVSMYGAQLPLFGAKRGPGCGERWLLVGPLAWVCGEHVEVSGEDPLTTALTPGVDGLPYRYYFTAQPGAMAYARLERAGEDAPDRELEGGWAVAVVEERMAQGQSWGRTTKNEWIAMRDLFPAHPTTFHGEEAHGALDFAWVRPARGLTFPGPTPSAASGAHVAFQRVGFYETKGPMVRTSPDGAATAEWMLASDLAHPELSAPPDEAGGASATERWVDVNLATQTLVAYEGARPVYATLVSSGRGGPNSSTPRGVQRIWVKITTSTMDDIERVDALSHYSIEDVPYVMFFNKAVALHGAFWHHDFGHVHSHGCVNMPPIDAKWLFDWTSPHMPAGWTAAYPTVIEKGTVVRVR